MTRARSTDDITPTRSSTRPLSHFFMAPVGVSPIRQLLPSAQREGRHSFTPALRTLNTDGAGKSDLIWSGYVGQKLRRSGIIGFRRFGLPEKRPRRNSFMQSGNCRGASHFRMARISADEVFWIMVWVVRRGPSTSCHQRTRAASPVSPHARLLPR